MGSNCCKNIPNTLKEMENDLGYKSDPNLEKIEVIGKKNSNK